MRIQLTIYCVSVLLIACNSIIEIWFSCGNLNLKQMTKLNYEPPQIKLVLLQIEEAIATGSITTVEVSPYEETLRISEYDTYQEGNKRL